MKIYALNLLRSQINQNNEKLPASLDDYEIEKQNFFIVNLTTELIQNLIINLVRFQMR